MADNATLTNQKTTFDADTNSDVPIRSTEKATKQVQHVIVDWGGTGAEDTSLPDFATQTTLSALNTKVTTVDTTDVRQATHDNLNGNANIQVGNVDVGGANPVPISAASLPLPSGAATSALQLPDGHNVTANAGTNLNTSALALESGGNLAAIATDTGNIDTSLNNIEAGYAAEGSALGSGVLLQGDDGTDRKNINVDATTGDVQVDVTNTVTVGSHDVTNAGTFAVQVTSDPALSHTTDSVTIGDGSNTATIRNLASNDALNVAIVDGSGGQITSFGGGTQYTDDTDTHSTGVTIGTAFMAAATPTDGSVNANDMGVVAMSTDRRLHVDSQIVGQDAALDVSAATVTVAQGTATNLKTQAEAYQGGTAVGAANPLQVTLANGALPNEGQQTMANSISVAIASNQSNVPVSQATASSLNAQVVGNVAHNAADSGNPVKVGGTGYSLAPTTSDTTPGPTAITTTRRANLLTGLQGELVAVPLAKFVTLSAINVPYDTSNETNTSANIDCFRFRTATLGATVVKTSGTPTDIQFIIEVSLDGTNYFEMKNGALGQWIYDDTYLASSKSVSYTFDIACQKIRVKVATNGTDGSNIFTVSNACLYLRS